MIFKRHLEKHVISSLKKYKIIALLGPRQSGKTTLARKVAQLFDYYNLEDPALRIQIREDPRGFLRGLTKNVIIDEIQNIPELMSYIQVFTDEPQFKFKFILTGSNSLQLSEYISQSLAGRVRIFYLLPLERSEIPLGKRPKNIEDSLLKGHYPRIYHQKLSSDIWIQDYIHTYVEKDVRQTIKLGHLKEFDKLLKLLAGRVGQIVNLSSLSGEVGLSVPTMKQWMSILESSFIIYQLSPHHKNFNKKITKSSKVYFYDTAIVCSLLRITKKEELTHHPLKGSIFENFIITEYIKKEFNKGSLSPYYFWRDQHGHEIDLVEERHDALFPIEIKVSQTFHPDFLKNIYWFNELQKRSVGTCIYGGDKTFAFKEIEIKSWKDI